MRAIVFFSQTGCLLPALIFFNLLFGRIFFKASVWLIIEVVLIILFIMNALLFTKKIFSAASVNSPRTEAIDIEGKVVEDTRHLPKPSSRNPI